MDEQNQVPAGWYPDPGGTAAQRWWDGTAWTDQTRADDQTDAADPPDTPARPAWRMPALVAGLVALVAVGAGGTILLLGDDDAEPVAQAATTPEDTDPADDEADDAEDADEPAADEPSPTDLRDVAWEEQEWLTTCTGTEEEPAGIGNAGQRQPVRLTPQDDDADWGLGWEHRNPHDPDVGLPAYEVDLASVAYGDLTGDGHDDAVFLTACTPGNFVVQHVEVWTHDADGAPRHLPVVADFDRYTGTVDRVEVVEGRLRLHHREPEPGDDMPQFNGYPHRVVSDLAYDDGHWSWHEVSRQEPPDPRDDGIDGLRLDLPGGPAGWDHDPRYAWQDPVVALLADAWGTSLRVEIAEARPIDVVLDEQRAMYDDFGYEVDEPWYEELDVPGADRAVHYSWVSPSGDGAMDTILLEVDHQPVEITYYVYIEDLEVAPGEDAFAATLASLEVDPDVFLHAIGR